MQKDSNIFYQLNKLREEAPYKRTFDDNSKISNDILNFNSMEFVGDPSKGGSNAGEEIVGTGHSKIRPTQEIVNRDKVDSYKERLLNGEKIEPIEVYEIEGKGDYLQEGHYRYVASIETGIPVEKKNLPHSGPAGMPNWRYVEWKEYINEEQFWED